MRLRTIVHIAGWILIILAFMGIIGCSTSTISINRLAPPKYAIEGGKHLAVVNFTSPQSAPSAGEKIASAFVSNLAPTKYYELMERSRMDTLMAEFRFSQTEYADPEKAKELGKMLNVDYIITGEVNAFSVEDENIFEREERIRPAGFYYDSHGYKRVHFQTYFVDIPVKIRRATVSASCRMIHIETSRIIMAESKTMNSQKKAYGSGEIASLPSRDQMLARLVDDMTAYFTTLIAPYPVHDVRTLEKGKTRECKTGYQLARNGLWDEAAAEWEKALASRPDDPSPFNNLGVAAEVRGDYDKACDYYTKALHMDYDSKLYMNHLTNARRLQELYHRPYTE